MRNHKNTFAHNFKQIVMRDLKHLLFFLLAVSLLLTFLPENDAKLVVGYFTKITKAIPPDLIFKILLATRRNSKKM